jgi:hypothetical protein
VASVLGDAVGVFPRDSGSGEREKSGGFADVFSWPVTRVIQDLCPSCLATLNQVNHMPLARTRFSCRDDTDFFFTMSFLACVNHQHDRDSASAATTPHHLSRALSIPGETWDEGLRSVGRRGELGFDPTVDASVEDIEREGAAGEDLVMESLEVEPGA